MERTAWTDERLDDLAGGVRELSRRIDAQGAQLRAAIEAQSAELRVEIEALRQTILRVGGGMMIGLVGVITAVLVRGV